MGCRGGGNGNRENHSNTTINHAIRIRGGTAYEGVGVVLQGWGASLSLIPSAIQIKIGMLGISARQSIGLVGVTAAGQTIQTHKHNNQLA